jgi:hypothetical protein
MLPIHFSPLKRLGGGQWKKREYDPTYIDFYSCSLSDSDSHSDRPHNQTTQQDNTTDDADDTSSLYWSEGPDSDTEINQTIPMEQVTTDVLSSHMFSPSLSTFPSPPSSLPLGPSQAQPPSQPPALPPTTRLTRSSTANSTSISHIPPTPAKHSSPGPPSINTNAPRTFGQYKIFSEDLQRLRRPRGWLSNDHIDALSFKFFQDLGHSSKAHVFPTTLMSYLMQLSLPQISHDIIKNILEPVYLSL